MEDPSKAQQSQEEEEGLTVEYANNVFFSPNIWDLKILFGELSGTKQSVDWHTSITLPWAQAKLMAYYLTVNIAVHEQQSGPIRVPESMLPPEPPPPPEDLKGSPAHQALIAFVREHRKKFLESLK
jgi:hypothetical protein